MRDIGTVPVGLYALGASENDHLLVQRSIIPFTTIISI